MRTPHDAQIIEGVLPRSSSRDGPQVFHGVRMAPVGVKRPSVHRDRRGLLNDPGKSAGGEGDLHDRITRNAVVGRGP